MFKKGRWSEDELKILKEYYKDGYAILVKNGLNRDELSVRQKARATGLFVKKSNPKEWSEEEVKSVVSAFKEGGMSAVGKLGIDKSNFSLRNKVYMLGLSGNADEGVLWNKEREDIMRKYYEAEGVEGVRKRGIKEPKDLILNKALKMGYDIKF